MNSSTHPYEQAEVMAYLDGELRRTARRAWRHTCGNAQSVRNWRSRCAEFRFIWRIGVWNRLLPV